MTLGVARVTDTFTDTDVIATGSTDVFVETLQIARLSDITTGHSLPGHGFYPPTAIATGSGSVFANNLPIARLTDLHAGHCDPHPDCHTGVISTSSGTVFSG